MHNVKNISEIREDYREDGLLEADVLRNPLKQFEQWMQEAIEAGIHQPNAMTVATATAEGAPSARILLLKEVTEEGFVFYTNYQSAKGKVMEKNPRVALVFLWLPLARQIRVEGVVKKTSASDSDAYFGTRPRGSQIGAWASTQSEVVASREILEDQFARIEQTYEGDDVPRPDHWGGYVLVPELVEFWQGRPSRLHDRIRYRKDEEDKWLIERLSP